jgi:hypothetical protein
LSNDYLSNIMTGETTVQEVVESLAKAGLVPGPAEDLIHGFEPKVNLEVSFAGKPVELGTALGASECKVAPAIAFEPEVRLLTRSTAKDLHAI